MSSSSSYSRYREKTADDDTFHWAAESCSHRVISMTAHKNSYHHNMYIVILLTSIRALTNGQQRPLCGVSCEKHSQLSSVLIFGHCRTGILMRRALLTLQILLSIQLKTPTPIKCTTRHHVYRSLTVVLIRWFASFSTPATLRNMARRLTCWIRRVSGIRTGIPSIPSRSSYMVRLKSAVNLVWVDDLIPLHSLRLWWRSQLESIAKSPRSLLHNWWLQHSHRRLCFGSERALSKSNRVGATIREFLHLTADPLHHTSSAWRVAWLYALHWLFSGCAHKWTCRELHQTERG